MRQGNRHDDPACVSTMCAGVIFVATPALSLCLFCLFPPLCLPKHWSPRLGYCIPRGKLCAGGKAPTWCALLYVSLGTDPFLIVIAVVIVIAATTATAKASCRSPAQ
jgi:hypothetical protein